LFGRSLRERIEELERDLYPVVRVNNYLDMPFAIFLYDPHDELTVRGEVQLLATRLKNKGKHVQVLSLAEVMQEALELALGKDGLKEFYDAERENGVEAAIQTVYQILSHERPLDKLVAERLHALDPATASLFLPGPKPSSPSTVLLRSSTGLSMRGYKCPQSSSTQERWKV